MSIEQDIFKNGSTTYYFSSKFFPKSIREDVFKLYSFVRIADDYVDSTPSNKKDFNDLVQTYNSLKNGNSEPKNLDKINVRVSVNMHSIERKFNFDRAWVRAFLDSMQADLGSKSYSSIDDSLQYVYGSAEVIGLMMGKILDLPNKALPYAQLQGRAMQWINFIRDIEEDNQLSRCYFPVTELEKFGLKDLTKKSAQKNPEAFNNFILFQIARYNDWQTEANKGYVYIPKRLQIPLMTARDMYNWTAEKIAENPMIVFDKKVKPTKKQVLIQATKNTTT